MSILSLIKHTTEAATGKTEGFAILNPLGALWQNRVWPTREAAEFALGQYGFDLEIVPAQQTIVWDKD